jgi:hypothetical protein
MEQDLLVSYQKANNTTFGNLPACFMIIHVVIANLDAL